ncbi:hypothetical protein KC960_05270 [Candidatus Saccharibacteria bacterium]|nr:hypothetical protein [Candidatus Saccharibacteria bacterium]
MKKKIKSYSRELRMPRLFMDDLEEVESIIITELRPREYRIETDDYEYNKLNEIKERNDPITNLHIKTYDPYISIDLNRFSSRIYASEDSLSTLGAITKITKILESKERMLLYKSQNWATWTAGPLTVIPLVILYNLENVTQLSKWGLLMIAMLSIVWWVASFYLSMYRYSIIFLTSKKDRPGFIKRNKDQIIVGVIIALFSFLIGLVM